MSLLDIFFGKKDTPASVAKNRLTVMLANERGSNAFPWIEDFKKDLVELIRKYTDVKDVKIKTDHNQKIEMLELDVILDKHH